MRIIILSRNGELYSTRSLYNAAKRRNHFVRIVDHMFCDLQIEKGENQVIYQGQSLKGYDVVIPRIGFTVTSYGAAVVRQFESMGVFTSLRAEALLRARNKLSCFQTLTSKGIAVPKTIVSNSAYGLIELSRELSSFPKILKLNSGTHGLGVLKIEDLRSLENMAETFYSMKQKLMLQEFISESSGQDLRVFIVDGEIAGAMLRQAQPGEFRSNLHRGGEAVVATLSPEEKETALAAARIMGLKVAGVDMLRSDRGPLVLEVNASPGLEGIETVTRLDIARKVIEFIERKAKKRN